MLRPMDDAPRPPRRSTPSRAARSAAAVFLAALLSSAPVLAQVPPPPRELPPGAPSGTGGVLVELHTDDPNTRIDRVVGNATTPVCFAPCRKRLDRNNLYVIEGDGLRSTSQFLLPDDHDQVTLDVHAGSSARLAGGVVLMIGGGIVSYIGLLVWEVGTLSHGLASYSNGDTRNSRSVADTGLVMMAIGIPATILGIYFAATTHTSVVSSSGATFTQDSPPPSRKRPLFALTPRGLEF
jgi:hypothetical protein